MLQRVILLTFSLLLITPSAQSQQCFPVERTYYLDVFDYIDVDNPKNPLGAGFMGREYANGALIAFFKKTVYYKLSESQAWSAMPASTLDSICDCYHNAATYGTFNAISGVATTREEYYDSEVFYIQSLASLEMMYPALFPRKNRFTDGVLFEGVSFKGVSDIFSPSGKLYQELLSMQCTRTQFTINEMFEILTQFKLRSSHVD